MKKSLPIIIVVVIVVAAGLVFLLTRNNNKSANNQTNTSSSSTSTDQMANMPKESSNSSQAQATDKVTIQNFAFSPASITVKKGTSVTWTNQDSATHTVTENDGQNGPNSSDLATGKSYSFTFNTVGTFKYHCSIHPSMTGTVTVTE